MTRTRFVQQLANGADQLRSRAAQLLQPLRMDRAAPHVGPIAPLAKELESEGATAVLTSEPAPGVLRIHLAGGSRRNVLGRSTLTRIESLVEFAPEQTRVILLTADGPDFCAGYDLFEAAREGAEGLLAHESNLAPLRRARCPIVAALHGNVIGGGLELALVADVRIASRETRFSIPAAALGLVYSEAGTRLLVGELGESTTRAMLLGGKTLTAKEARTSGLVMEVVGPEQLETRALELARRIASWSPVATSGNRRMLDVIAGRAEGDTAAIRLASFAPDSALAGSIDRFVTRRAAGLPGSRTTYRQQLPERWHVAMVRGRQLLNRRIERLLPNP